MSEEMVNIAFEIIAGNVVTQWKNAKTINNPLSLNCRTLSLFLKKKNIMCWIPTFLAMLLILNWKIYFDPKIDLLLPELDDFRSFEPISEAFSSIRCIGKDKKFNEGVLGSETQLIVSIGFLSSLLLRNTS